MSSEAVVDPGVQSKMDLVESQNTSCNPPPPTSQAAEQSAYDPAVADWVTLTLLPGCGPGTIRKLVDHFGSPGAALAATRRQWSDVSGLGSKQLAAWNCIDECSKTARLLANRTISMGGQLLSIDDAAFPELLREIPDPPAVLYCLGDIGLLTSSSVAMVGSRSATSYGRRVARSLAEGLSREGLTVVSGMALGIDSESHIGALQGRGGTIGVLGCGIDVVYPRQNSSLYHEVKTKGLLISEYPPGTRPEGFRFPARNRIIAGLSKGVVVVEAARKSGSLITAQLGLDFGREIFAVPGQVDSYKSEGAHWLLQQGAQLVMSAADIVAGTSAYYNTCGVGTFDNQPDNNIEQLAPGLEPDAIELLKQLEPYPVSREEVSEKLHLSPARLSELFLYLELEGVVEMGPGDMVRRTV
ncbi:DNA-processing protein DprA [Desulfosediminicola ganghwensis]|uniref:DNA-processing protein DprA n=1 Tax=Desulfosediminicola ganghwensis TaxID=2569540 RepID=UPI0010ACF3B2|nr:DNA-processing protein DprA [Desulfosediminicola ganghwensis]